VIGLPIFVNRASNPCKILANAGHSGSGTTVAVQNAAPAPARFDTLRDLMAIRTRLFAAALPLLIAGGCAEPPAPPPPPRADILLEQDREVIEARVPPNATLAGLLRAHRVSEDLALRIVDAARDAFDPRRLRADQPYRIEMGMDGLVRLFEYKIDADRFLRIVGGEAADAPTFDATVLAYEKQRETLSLHGIVDREHPSLVAAMQARGESVMLAMSLADVFGGDIDFNNDLQPGDAFEVLFDKEMSEGEFAGYGDIHAAEFRNDGRVLRAFRFVTPDGKAGYYDEQGRSLKRFFLRSPLKFEPRISSGFSFRRLHPVLGTWRSHPAIDYVAPVGAPVVAIASGVVVRAGWAGGAGNMVTVRHNNGYESSYLHLSAITRGVRAGVRVGQGEVIGRVGKTGLATGPHLDYRLKKDGKWVNPLVEHKRLPPGEPIPADLMAAFEASRNAALERIATAPAAATAVAAAAPAPAERPAHD
jgi:murein DD-endopeptidase MepM/ murein hydrolase activator NlpD